MKRGNEIVERIVIWGVRRGYLKIRNILKKNEECGNIEIVAFVDNISVKHRGVFKPEEFFVGG